MGASKGDGKGQRRATLKTNNPGQSWQRHEGVATTPQLWSAAPQVPQDAKITSLLQEKLWCEGEGSLSWQGHFYPSCLHLKAGLKALTESGRRENGFGNYLCH